MRDRCGRYSLLKMLQQWETLQKRCRLGIRSGKLSKRKGPRYDYRYTTDNKSLAPPPSSSSLSQSQIDEIEMTTMREAKRSRLPYYGPLTINNYYDDEDDGNNGPDRNAYYDEKRDDLEAFCPTVFEAIHPLCGRNHRGHMLELFKDADLEHKFFEYRCHPDYLNKPCRYLDSHHRKNSKCVQQYLDTYALVRSDETLSGWAMEHVRLRTGCACKVDRVRAAASRRRKKLSSTLQRSSLLMAMGHIIPEIFIGSGNNNNDRNKNKRRVPTPSAPLQPFGSRNGNIDY